MLEGSIIKEKQVIKKAKCSKITLEIINKRKDLGHFE